MSNTAKKMPEPEVELNFSDQTYRTTEQPKLVSWGAIAALFADVVVSPWNLLIGALLVSKLSILASILSVGIGYTLLGILIYFYGGLGYKTRLNTSELIEPVFGVVGTKMFFSALLALGQIGWFAIITQIGGESLGILMGQPASIGIITYAVLMWIMASLQLHHFGFVKAIIVASSVALMGYLIWSYTELSPRLGNFWAGEGLNEIMWGVSVVLVSLISFVSVSPDFLHQVKRSEDVIKAIMYGLCLPGAVVVSLGVFLFVGFDGAPSIAVLIGASSMVIFGHLINILTNTDAAVAAYTPGFRFCYMFGISLRKGIFLSCFIGVILALLGITSHLESWLSLLAGVYPALIGVCLAHYSLVHFGMKFESKRQVHWRGILVILCSSAAIFVVNLALLHWLVGLCAFTLYVLMMGVTVNIYIGKTPS